MLTTLTLIGLLLCGITDSLFDMNNKTQKTIHYALCIVTTIGLFGMMFYL